MLYVLQRKLNTRTLGHELFHTDGVPLQAPIIHLILIYLLTAIGLTAGGSSTVHIYTQTVHRTTQLTTRITQLATRTTQLTTN
jgi:uncharacterized integral membrane protein